MALPADSARYFTFKFETVERVITRSRCEMKTTTSCTFSKPRRLSHSLGELALCREKRTMPRLITTILIASGSLSFSGTANR